MLLLQVYFRLYACILIYLFFLFALIYRVFKMEKGQEQKLNEMHLSIDNVDIDNLPKKYLWMKVSTLYFNHNHTVSLISIPFVVDTFFS